MPNVGEEEIVFAISFVKNKNTNHVAIHVKSEKGFTLFERIGMLEYVKTQLTMEDIFKDETNKSEPTING